MKEMIKKIALLILAITIFLFLIIWSSNDFDKRARECDKAYGYTCTYYQVKNFRR